MAVLLWLLIKDTPSQPVNPTLLSIINPAASQRDRNHLCSEIVCNLDIWILCLSNVLFTILRYCVSDWSQLYFIEAADLTEAKSMKYLIINLSFVL